MIALTHADHLDLVRGVDPKSHDATMVARAALKIMGARLDDESPLTAVFVPRALKPARLPPRDAAGASGRETNAVTDKRRADLSVVEQP